jgi:hypothetical protein
MAGATKRSKRSDAARRFFRHERRLSLVNDTQKIGRRLVEQMGATLPALDETYRASPITFAWRVQVKGGAPKGVMMEYGAQAIGCAAWINDDGIAGIGVGNQGVSITPGTQTWTAGETEKGVLYGRPYPYLFVFAINPGDGSARLWLDGRLILARQSSFGLFSRGGAIPSLWAGTGPGTFFAAPGNITRTAIIKSAPADMTNVGGLSIFHRQIPQHYGTCEQDLPI